MMKLAKLLKWKNKIWCKKNAVVHEILIGVCINSWASLYLHIIIFIWICYKINCFIIWLQAILTSCLGCKRSNSYVLKTKLEYQVLFF